MRGRDLAGEPGAAWTQAVASELLDRGTTTFETTVRTGDGRQLPLEVSAHRFTEGGRTLVLAVARDISERRQWEAETHRLNHALRTMLDIHGHITGTHSEKEMLEHACYEFTETRSFREAWSITLDEQWAVGNLAHAGLEEAGARFEAHLHTAGLPPCAADALRRRATVVHRPSPEYCQGCPLYPRNRSGSNACTVIASPMRYGDTVLGVLGAGVDEGWIRQGEQELFEQVTADLALALNNARTQTALSESEQRYRHMVEEAPIGIFRSTVSGRLLFANLTLARMFGFASAEELVQTYVDLGSQAYQDPEDRREFLDLLQRNGRVHGFEKAFRTRDGDTLWGSLYARLWSPESGGEQLIDGFIQDRSQAKHAEEKLRKTLREREVLLKEVHHRVRNNLNVIVSLLHLRSNTLTDTEDALEAFRETENRIRSMAHIHSSLYESGESGTIDVEDYIKSLVNAVLLSYDIGASVAVEYRLEHIELGFSVAMPVGLIVHEAVSNALKHAFSSEDNGHIVVTLTRKSTEHCLLRVADNGFGLPAHAFEPQAESLGVALMHSLAEQLGGGLSMESNEGAVISVLFPCPEEQPIELHSEEDQDA
jgi:PAS domain S-box-containing protein